VVRTLDESRVGDVMTRNPVAVTPTTSVLEAARLMRELGVSALPVVDDERLIGIVTERDLVWKVIAEVRPVSIPVSDVMTRSLVVIRETETLSQALYLMSKFNIRHLPVVDEQGRLIGILSLRDIEYALI